jgi:hypothetical protein
MSFKSYPTIPTFPRDYFNEHGGKYVWFFDKLDGSNVRAEWRRKGGWTKFGKRHGLIDMSNQWLTEAEELIRTQHPHLPEVFAEQRWERATAFFEFHGPGSFAGNHADEPHRVTLLDVVQYKRGRVPPAEFVKLFEESDRPAVLWRGILLGADGVMEEVRDGTLEGMTFEGVVVKTGAFDRKSGGPLMWKIKNRAWLEKLRGFCGDDEKKFEALK